MPTYCTSSALLLSPRLIEQGESFPPSLVISFNTSYCSTNIVIPLLKKKKKCIEKKKTTYYDASSTNWKAITIIAIKPVTKKS